MRHHASEGSLREHQAEAGGFARHGPTAARGGQRQDERGAGEPWWAAGTRGHAAMRHDPKL